MNRTILRVAAMAVAAALSVGATATSALALPGEPIDPTLEPSPSPSPSSTSTSTGRYRVTLEKFRVTSQTYDNFFQTDGKGDEVFASFKNVMLDRTGRIIAQGENTTVTMGDRNGFPTREQAGSASSMGGLRAGDVHYTRKLLWEGPLGNGETTVVSPVLWEWDGGGDGFREWTSWASRLATRLNSASNTLLDPNTKAIISLVDLGLASVADMPVGSAGDKPIGSITANGTTSFVPQMLNLDQATAEYIINNNVVGEGQGVISIRYAGSNDHGTYTLYLRVARA